MYVYISFAFGFCSAGRSKACAFPTLVPSTCVYQTSLQLIVATALASKVGEVHDLDDHAGPAGEVLGALAGSGVGVVLLPREACLAPGLVYGVHKVLAQLSVHGRCALLLGTGLLGDVLLGLC